MASSYDLKIGNKTFSGVDKITLTRTDGNSASYIVPSGTKTITENNVGDEKYTVTGYKYVKVNVPTEVGNVTDSQHYAFGYLNRKSNEAFSVSGITDQQGNAFEPKGFAFMIFPTTKSEKGCGEWFG